jgi:hypothetical protein
MGDELADGFDEGAMNNIVELRQYTMKPGRRDELIELFEREFIETQEVLGMDVIGTFRDADDPNRFVWLRGYADMESRGCALSTFYSGPVWKAHRDAAVATMEDTDDVLLLRPAWCGSSFSSGAQRAPRGACERPPDLVMAAICYFDKDVSDSFVASFRSIMPARCEAGGATLVAALVTEKSANNFPAHPIREGEHVFIWFAHVPDVFSARPVPLHDDLAGYLCKPMEVLRLRPTARSRPLKSQ